MTSEAQVFIDAVESGETTDAGGMTTTQDVADIVPYAFDKAEQKLRALESEGVLESTTFGNSCVWTVADGGDDSRDETTATQTLPTSTRGLMKP